MKKIISITILLLMIICLCSCKNEIKQDKKIITKIKDGAGRDINIYEDANSNTAASVYFVAVPFFTALKMNDRVLAVNTRNNFWKDANDDLNKARTVGKGTVDLEKLASYNPTCLVHRSNDMETVDAVKNLGIDVLCIKVENAEDIVSTLNIMGQYFGEEENAKKAIDWFNVKIDKIDNIVSKIPLEERKTALLIGSSIGRVAGNDMLQTWMIEKAGGIAVVEEGLNHNWVDIGIERVFSYNPDYIFSTSSAAKDYDIDDFYLNDVYSGLKAQKNKNIYNIPTKLDSWDMPGLSCVLGIDYMLYRMYPSYFSLEDLEDEVDDYYRFMFNRCFDKELEIDWNNFE